MPVYQDEAGNRLLLANAIPDDSWLRSSRRYEWFVRGYEYARNKTLAIPALSVVSPEDMYHAVWLIIRGAGLPDPETTEDEEVAR